MLKVAFIAIAIILATFAAESEAIKCFNCEVKHERYVGYSLWDCRDNLITCPEGFDVCLKESTNQMTKRTCGKSAVVVTDPTKQQGCDDKSLSSVSTDLTYGAKSGVVWIQKTCCTTDKCNSSSALVNNKSMIAAFLFIAALFLKH